MYADWAYYSGEYGGTAPQQEVVPLLGVSSDTIDTLIFDRIRAIGWDRLTPFQQGLVKKACCVQADFLRENADAVESAMTRYSINGVSMEFGNAALYRVVGGVAVSNAAMALLRRSGLACLMARGREVEPCAGPDL